VDARVVTAVDGIDALRTIRPVDVAELRAAVREIAASGEALVATGLGAHLDIGAPPRRLDVMVGFDRVARIVDHQAADMTVTVEAGCSLAVLARTLAAAGQWLPLDPPRPAETTVGGLVAANLSGPLRASQGTVRDLLLGLRIVDGEGRLVSGGGKVVKNVAGYDLPKLHVGALGTLGVIVEATFKVRPRPEREAAVVLRAAAPDDAARIALAVRDAIDPLWLEAGTFDDGAAAVVGVGGTSPELAAMRRTIDDVAGSRATAIEWHDDGEALRVGLGGFAVEPCAAVLRASVLPGDVPWAIARMRTLAADAPVLAHVANGVVRCRLAHAAAVPHVLSVLRSEVETRGGFVMVERALATVKPNVDVWGHPGEGLALMRRVKAAFDPRGLFAPGRYVGGL
jgi:glycolate oxidase FAD binding subunit